MLVGIICASENVTFLRHLFRIGELNLKIGIAHKKCNFRKPPYVLSYLSLRNETFCAGERSHLWPSMKLLTRYSSPRECGQWA